ncbi:MAG TPA: solute carrier family 23 protein, partial [Nitrolancea sp.]|nr:solute carrier family 23 protein [Nitrolancea sp.]
AAAEIVGTEITDQRLNRGIAGAAAGSMVSALFGGFATTAYAQNVGLLRLTKIGTRHAVTYAGAIFLVLAFVPKLGALLAATPDPVVGGIFLPAAGSLIVVGIDLLAKMAPTERNYMVAGLAVMLGVGLPLMGDPLFSKLSRDWSLLLSQQIVVGAVVAIVLQLALVQIPDWIGARGSAKQEDPKPEPAD